MSSLGGNSIGVNDANCADAGAEAGALLKVHGRQRQLTIDAVFELAFVLRAVEAPFRFCDESVIVDLPKFVSADANAFPSATGASVRAGERPMELVPSESRVTLSIVTTMSGRSRMNPRVEPCGYFHDPGQFSKALQKGNGDLEAISTREGAHDIHT